ncbi:hypothetical protein Pan181_12490 [Aeoliella mucimassa]|uniref:Methanolan biosynthesis EpsI domain-containing protein n=2 Tax=Aeoliella mucimassa TaxID=2527972 RepID=A0A518AK05_9BACT|nr:hypothetical protein Pan181_12490 [Aeoliella mucimassa]
MVKLLNIAVIVAAVAITAGSSLLVERVYQRWGNAEDLVIHADALNQFPMKFGEWECLGEQEVPEYTRNLLKYKTAIWRDYQKQDGVESVQFMALVGTPGPLVRHPPEVCYDQQGYPLIVEPKTISIDVAGVEHTFKATTYGMRGAPDDHFIVATSWSDCTTFERSAIPRARYGGSPFVYAVQALTKINHKETEQDAMARLKNFLTSMATDYPAYFDKIDNAEPNQ